DSPDSPRFLPVGLKVQDKHCLVVGGGSVGARKVRTLLRAGAIVTIVSPSVTEDLAERIEAGGASWVRDEFREEHLGDAFLVIAATDDDDTNAAVVRLAGQRGALVCDASSPERSEIIFGALLHRDDVTVAVFTDGRDPAHAQRTRDEIADLVAGRRPSKPEP
ncbi:MAG: bifunctional precorrin-2 dehydrogenase/sirohydrochlorin ferrochelatase, partial [Planctomycetota bacterium]